MSTVPGSSTLSGLVHQVDFTPPGARRFFSLPMHELAGKMVAFDDILGRGGQHSVAG